MRIGIDARYALRKTRRGIGNYIFNLLSEFKRLHLKDFTYCLYADRMADTGVMEYFHDGPFEMRILSAPNLALWEQFALPIAARRDRLDVLHCPANIAPVVFKPCPIVTTIHDVIEFRRREFGDIRLTLRHRISRFYRMGVLPRVTKVSDLIITVSEFSRRDIADVLGVPLGKIKVTYEAPVEIPASGRDYTKERPPGLKGDYIFALGAVDKRKNTAFLLNAYNGLPEAVKSRVSLVVAGVEKPNLFASLAGKGIHLYGYMPDEIVASLYRNALFFVYPSLYEGFGLPVLEAMRHGVPVLCSGTTAVGEVAGGAALVFDPTDITDLHNKMLMLIENPALRQELVEKGNVHVTSFSWQRCAKETLALYEQVGKSKRRNRE
ncbi:glycosyltransferase [Desulfofundulus thermobenzoicus]|uniref:Glycosyltransferase n=1 Tax=Desulfofundulus thermobenzoicus TaxID=29376 RepID=A0A6N7IQB9_9FIRM|nr:glycosyltransferase family 1 protein [Desulfofundulus thermobenzoicus]MQL51388.1 glycosyltransferase [Desulfofundulus thermobenzoicus]